MLEEGRRLYVQECQLCHGDAGTGKGALPNTPIHAPRGHTWHHPDGQLKELILGTLDYPGRTMPGFAEKMTGSEVDAVLEYMKSNWPAELREAQEEISRNWLEQSRDESDQ
ncbi:MAG: cytochrome c [Chloroflexi bacterium]|nr:cytochrome c [Chloroflexota bacterium]